MMASGKSTWTGGLRADSESPVLAAPGLTIGVVSGPVAKPPRPID